MIQIGPRPRLHKRWRTPCFDKLDRLDWPYTAAFECFDVRVGLRATDAALLDALCERLPSPAVPYSGDVVDRMFSAILGGPDPGSRIRRFHLLYENHVRLARATRLDALLEAFRSHLRISIGEVAPERIFVHAGVVEWMGQGILLPGRSASGKTTLVTELVRAGATYYSDEFAILDADGRVYPFPEPLAIRRGGDLKQTPTPVAAIGGTSGQDPVPVGLVLLSAYKAGASWRPRRLSPGRGALEMLANALSARHAPERTLRTLSKVAADAVVIKTPRRDAADVAPRLLAALEGHVSSTKRGASREEEMANSDAA